MKPITYISLLMALMAFWFITGYYYGSKEQVKPHDYQIEVIGEAIILYDGDRVVKFLTAEQDTVLYNIINKDNL